MHRSDKERVVAELTERLQQADTLIVADYRGLTNSELEALRGKLVEHGARLSVVKNTLTRRAAEAAGAEALLALLEGPSAIAFVETDGDAVAVAKALSETAKDTRVLAVRGGIMQGKAIDSASVEELAKLPPLDVLRGQVIGAVVAPLMQLVGLVNAPVRDFVGLIDARIEQLGGDAAEASAEPEAPAEPSVEAEPEPEPEDAAAPAGEAAADTAVDVVADEPEEGDAPAAEEPDQTPEEE